MFPNQVKDNVIGNGSNYLNAYWEIRYIRTYLAEGAVSPTSSVSVSPTSGFSGASGANTTNSASLSKPSKASSARSLQLSIPLWGLSLLSILVIGL